MMDHNMCFKGEIWKIIPKLFLLLLLIWSFGLALWKERGTGGVLEKLKEKALKGFRYRIDSVFKSKVTRNKRSGIFKQL